MNSENSIHVAGGVVKTRNLGDKGVRFTIDVPMGGDRSPYTFGPLDVVAWNSDVQVPPIGVRDFVVVDGFVKRDPVYKREGYDVVVVATRVEVVP